MSNVTLIHSNLPQIRQRWLRWAPRWTSPTPHNDDNGTTQHSLSQHRDTKQMTMTKTPAWGPHFNEEQYPWTTTIRPSFLPHAVGVLSVDNDASTDFNASLIHVPRHNLSKCAAPYSTALSYCLECGGVGVSAIHWHRHIYVCSSTCEHPRCGVLVWGWCRRAKVVPIPPARVPPYFICRHD